ncbi:MAG: SRPBCC family protein [Planctomycetes bacterium]|jgi:uncharacterized protein YndB with AHSA1/START domain|nr:SRPBCC family protein [Planctomycetota bacterium]
MTDTSQPSFDLSITRLIAAPRAKLFRAWTEPALLQQWFTPRPWTTPVVRTDPRAGGSNYFLMRGPAGEEHPCHGVYLEVVQDRRIVFTDAFTSAWVPSAKPFMVGIITFDDENGGTRYTATARHWTAEDRATHEQMGFYSGWNAAADQLEALVRTL